MKRFLAFALAFLALSVTTLRADNDRIIEFNELPKAAQQFVTKYFAGRSAVLVKLDRDFMSTTYEVTLSDGTEIDFNSNGLWKDVDANYNTMPLGFIPAQITKTLNARHAGDPIKQIERKGRGYKVELSSGLEAYFNAKLQLVRYDD